MAIIVLSVGSSPHTRGAPVEIAAVERAGGIIPAYAGSTASAATTLAAASDHPRIRGEHSSWSTARR